MEAEEPTAFRAPPLPLLKELKWYAERSPQPALAFRRFLGVRPVVLARELSTACRLAAARPGRTCFPRPQERRCTTRRVSSPPGDERNKKHAGNLLECPHC
jgi:hypothetical protein